MFISFFCGLGQIMYLSHSQKSRLNQALGLDPKSNKRAFNWAGLTRLGTTIRLNFQVDY